MATGIFAVNGDFHNFGTNGIWQGRAKQNSWARNKSGKWMYIDENGNISYARKLNVNGVTYYFNGTGNGIAGGDISLAENCSWFNPDDYMYYWTNATGTGLDQTSGWKNLTMAIMVMSKMANLSWDIRRLMEPHTILTIMAI